MELADQFVPIYHIIAYISMCEVPSCDTFSQQSFSSSINISTCIIFSFLAGRNIVLSRGTNEKEMLEMVIQILQRMLQYKYYIYNTYICVNIRVIYKHNKYLLVTWVVTKVCFGHEGALEVNFPCSFIRKYFADKSFV